MKRTGAVFCIILGCCIIGATVFWILKGIKHPTINSTIVIALLSSIGVPISLAAIGAGIRWSKKPDSATLRTEVQAKRRAAEALEDAETAEKIKLELDAYIALRARRLEIERRRRELTSTAEILSQSYGELNKAEAQLGIETTHLDAGIVEILDSFVEPSGAFPFPDVRIYGIPVGQMAQQFYEKLDDLLEKRKLRRLARLAPEALEGEKAARAKNGSPEN
jgi:hypothetical protein